MVQRIAYRLSALVLLVTALCIVALLIAGLSRAIASSPEPAAQAEPKVSSAAKPRPEKPQPAAKLAQTETVKVNPIPVSSPFAVKRILEIDEPFVHGYWIWDEEGAPETGEIVITVDLKAESLSVFRDGYEIGAAVITFGDAKKPTPTGVFPITQKSKDHVSNIYHTPMPYMLRMTNDGISIHGTDVKWGWGTRGCIGIPTEFAKQLFGAVKLGDRVIVTNGKIIKQGDPIITG